MPQRRMPTMVGRMVHCVGRPGVVHLVEALHGLVLVVLAAFQQVMHGHGLPRSEPGALFSPKRELSGWKRASGARFRPKTSEFRGSGATFDV